MTDALEVRLLRWGESSQAGRTVTFLLPGEGEHPFRGLKTGKDGELFAIAVARIEDPKAKADHIYGGNDGYTDNSGPKDKTAPKSEGARAVQRASLLARDPVFLGWIDTGQARGKWATPPVYEAERMKYGLEVAYCRQFILDTCGIGSRRDLAVNPEALEKFLSLEMEYRHRDTVGR